jgi:hypothetical protein
MGNNEVLGNFLSLLNCRDFKSWPHVERSAVPTMDSTGSHLADSRAGT